MSHNYGLTTKDLDDARTKIQKQKNYLTSQTFLTDSGQEKSLLDVSYSANLSKRYYPRILNKVNTFISYGLDAGLTPIFLTITLDGFFRDLMKGDFTRYTEEKKEEYKKHIPNNDRYGYYRDYLDEGNTITPKDCYKIMSFQLHRFMKTNAMQSIRQVHELDYTMIRVTEPHKDGVPHMHILAYVPEHLIPSIFQAFKKSFPAPQNHKKITMKYDKRHAKSIGTRDYETKGFQTEIRSPAGYILKYILKSFVNLIEEKEVDYLQAWYIHNRIPRLITTHTLLAQDVYYHASMLDDDWYYLSNIKRNHTFIRDRMMKSFTLIEEGRELHYDNGHYKIINNGKTVIEFGINRAFKMKFTVECPIKYPKPPATVGTMLSDKYWRFKVNRSYKYKINQPDKIIEVESDGKFLLFDTKLGVTVNKYDLSPVAKFSDLDLFEWFYNFDMDKYGEKKFGYLKRVMIERGLLQGIDVPLQDYNTDFHIGLNNGDIVQYIG